MCFAKYFNFLLWMGRGGGVSRVPRPKNHIWRGGGGRGGGGQGAEEERRGKGLERIKKLVENGKEENCAVLEF
jgi:hypothetical protein